MSLRTKITTALLAGLCLVSSGMVLAAESAPDTPANPAIEQKALDLLENMSDYLAAAKTMTFTANAMVTAPVRGQLLNFFSNSNVTVKRPNGLKVETRSDSRPTNFYFDGKTMSILSPREKMFASIAAPATLDELFPFAVEKAGINTNFSDILTSDPYAYMTYGLTSAFSAGQSTVRGVLCDHLAFRGDGIEWQIWISTGKKPLPLMMTITYTDLADKPSLLLRYSDWKLNVPVAKDAFVFKKPAGATQIKFMPSNVSVTDAGGTKK
jgi:hypothetical protein